MAFEEFLDPWFRFHPHHATERGYGRYDDKLPSFSEEAVGDFQRFLKAYSQKLSAVGPPPKGTDAWLDQEVLKGYLDTALFGFEKLKFRTRNPLIYVQAALDGIQYLETRLDLGRTRRDRALRRRLLEIPRLMLELRSQVQSPEAPHTEASLEMLQAGIEHFGERFSKGNCDRALTLASEKARQAFDETQSFLLKQSSQTIKFQPMGEKNYLFLLKKEHRIYKSIAELESLARKILKQVKAEFPKEKRVKNKILTNENLTWRQVWSYYESEVSTLRKFISEKKLVRVPEGELILQQTPSYLETLIPGASYHPPPVLLKGPSPGYFFVRAIPRKMDAEQKKYYSEVIRNRHLRTLVAHEAYPGHHLQFLWAKEHPSRIRKLRDNDLMIEGWAFYCEFLMKEQGLWESLPSPRPLRALQFRALRVLVDIAIHTGKKTLKQAVQFLCDHLGTANRYWIELEVRRYALEPTQALSYLIGREEILELRRDWFDEHPDSTLELFHNRFLSEGSIPIALIREKMMTLG